MNKTDTITMSTDENYGFDVAGFLHLRHVFTPLEVERCNGAIDAVNRRDAMLEWPAPHCEPFRLILENPALRNFLEALLGPEFVIDHPVSLVPNGADPTSASLMVDNPERSRRLRYVNNGKERKCLGLRVVIALTNTSVEGGVVLVPASHKRRQNPPADFLSGANHLEMTEEPILEPGDVLICTATLLHGVRGQPGRLLEVEYISARAMPVGGYPKIDPPCWTAELKPEQRAVVGTRTSGQGGTVISDGQRTWVKKIVEQPASVAFNMDENSIPDPDELWFWDVRGYLVLRGVMDEEWLAAANRAIDATLEAQPTLGDGHPSAIEEVPEQALRENNWEWPEDTSTRIYGEINRPRIGGLYELPKPHCEPFRRMIGHPVIVKRLNWMLGYGFRESTEPMCCVYPKGTTGGSLHGQGAGSYEMLNGRQLLEQVNVAWALQNEAAGFGENSGGFVCVPGSHKAAYAIPPSLHTSIDLPQVYKPQLNAGDVLFFGSVAHGTTAWRSDWERRTAIQFMGSGNVALPPGKKRAGWRWSSDPNNPANRPASKT